MNKLNVLPSYLEDILSGERHIKHLTGTFLFDETPQGLKYWFNRIDDVENGKPLSKTARGYLESFLRQARNDKFQESDL